MDLTVPNPSWETLRETMPYNACSSGALVLSPGKTLICGGWEQDEKASDRAFIFKASIDDYSATEIAPLGAPDIFLVLGTRHRNIRDKEIVIFGKDHAHLYNETEKTFSLLN